jgi:serine/threonine-protein kinase RsbW
MQQPAAIVPGLAGSGEESSAEIALPIRLTALAELSDWVQALAQAQGLPEGCAFRLELVLAESVTNVIEHGYPPDAEGLIQVRVSCEPGRVVVQLDDAGRPFDPTAAPAHQQPGSLAEAPIGGLGLQLIRSYTEDWSYRRVDERNRQWLTIACDA